MNALKLAIESGSAAAGGCLAVAQKTQPDFSDRAETCVIATLGKVKQATGEMLTDVCKRSGIVPHDDRAFGPIIARLSRAGRIRRCGYALRAKGHGTPGATVWELC